MTRAAFRYGEDPKAAFKATPPPKEEPGVLNQAFDKAELAVTACFAKMYVLPPKLPVSL
jgi:hypothetical protein